MEKVKNVIGKCYRIIAYIAVVVLLLGINFTHFMNGGIGNFVKSIIAVVLGIGILMLLDKHIFSKIKSKKVNLTILISGLVIFLVLEIISYIFFKVGYGWDFGFVMRTAESLVKTGKSEELYYFLMYPHNNGCLAIECLGMILCLKNVIGAYVINIIFVFLSALFAVLSSKKIGGYKMAINTLLMLILFAPLYLYIPIVYTDTLSVMFPVITLYLYLLTKDINKKENVINFIWILMAIINVCAFLIKPVSAIVYVAIIIEKIFNNPDKKILKQLGISVILFVLLLGNVSTILQNNVLRKSVKQYKEPIYAEDRKCPSIHYIMIGLSKPTSYGGTCTFGWGGYSDEDLAYTMSRQTYDMKVEVDKAKINERLCSFGPYGYISFLWHKFDFVWNDGTYYVLECIRRDPVNNESKLHELVLGKYMNNISIPYMNYFNDVIMLLILIGAYLDLRKNKKDEIRILEISMVGIAMFLLIWEARSRYIYFMIPVFAILASNGLNLLQEKIKNIKVKKLNESNKNK